jgi:hypothetical protein
VGGWGGTTCLGRCGHPPRGPAAPHLDSIAQTGQPERLGGAARAGALLALSGRTGQGRALHTAPHRAPPHPMPHLVARTGVRGPGGRDGAAAQHAAEQHGVCLQPDHAARLHRQAVHGFGGGGGDAAGAVCVAVDGDGGRHLRLPYGQRDGAAAGPHGESGGHPGGRRAVRGGGRARGGQGASGGFACRDGWWWWREMHTWHGLGSLCT